MKKSLAMFGLFGLFVFMLAAVFAPFANPWFFLLMIPCIAIIPHMDRIFDYFAKMLDDET